MNTYKMLYTSAYIVIASFIGTMLAALFIALYPFQVIKVHDFHVTKVSDNRVYFVMKLDKYIDTKPEVKWFLVDGVVFELNPARSTLRRPVGKSALESFIPLPTHSSLCGRFRLRAEINYELFGGLRSVGYILTSKDTFSIPCNEQK